MKKVLVIAGPTAVGKTALGVTLAQKFNGEVISGDSLQVYRQLDIGTAKVTPTEAQGIPHHLIDIRDFTEDYSVAEFQKAGRALIDEITASGHLPIVVGGTGLYLQALLYDFKLGAAAEINDSGLREKYQAYADQQGKEALWQLLQQKDPVAAEKIHFNNTRKVIRALEVFETTGHSIMQPEETPEALYDYFLIGLNTARDLLYQRINQRVDLMMQQGLLQEAQLLKNAENVQAAKGIGYREFFPYFKGQQTLAEVVENIKQDSRRYAKRQLTWFNNRMQAHWFDLVQHPEEEQAIIKQTKNWLEV